MNKRQRKQIIHNACELLELKSIHWSCNALDKAKITLMGYSNTSPSSSYAEFYEKRRWGGWQNADGTNLTLEQRILLLLFFAECSDQI